ncbi:hydroxyethylthiazole kinase [Desulfobacter hydrogenophilus]|uniref:Hydroxyethylthiazole kinase n=1 Tax=Desulfobacter hydrogenophilus TaxID=2291 RepID=A0A328FA56_9BACT|nr:hydroxyethylthiazole kinase [Desulfobacter hydrogenophilus]NDY73705.1 hydroxyethylthiazole kinase [Desulfobacter hydrogenophilus]QBH11793.1 hydroxyethylthiazole kinase [Desulfobacter hydrogenophilus]RAM00570.1 hydroxyethylthiazole kinase [Desulfobacter hydrogenophilus]
MSLKKDIQAEIIHAVETVQQTNPMAGSVTNTVTINFVANAQLAVGGSAAMVYMPDEAQFLSQAGGAAYINMGTIEPVYEKTLPGMAETLHNSAKPWVLDPVAIGIGELRTRLLLAFKSCKPSIIRGNASEIIALAGLWGLDGGTKTSNVRGVDSQDTVSAAKDGAVALARWTGGAVAVSGKQDLVTNGSVVALCHGGSHFMEKITGSGCSLGGVMAVYATAAPAFIAALTGTAVYNLAGSRAAEKTDAPASFQVHFLDELYKAKPRDIAENPFDIEEI